MAVGSRVRAALGRMLVDRHAASVAAGGPAPQGMTPEVQGLIDVAVEKALQARRESEGPSYADRIAAYESSPLNSFGLYTTSNRNMPDKTGVTVQGLRNFVKECPVAGSCISTRVNQASAFAQRAEGGKYGVLDKPSWRIRTRDRKSKIDEQDRANIAALSRFIECNGWVEPPEAERPVGWQPDFGYTLKTMIPDTMTLDWTPLMRWPDAQNPHHFPLVAFSTQDPAVYRRWLPDVNEVRGGRMVSTEPIDQRPAPTVKPHRFCRLQADAARPVGWYTEDELAVMVRNPSTETSKAGYGTSETEVAIQAIRDMIDIALYNSSRFSKDHLPRGFINVLGNVSTEARTAFAMQWKQMMEGQRWAIPILSSVPPGPEGKGGHSVQWVPMDNQGRDMEYAQLYYQSVVVLHSAYHISPEETGLAEASPFSSSLSEASPEAYIKWSRDQFGHLMIDLARFINRELIWRMPGGKRYVFEWVGLVEYEATQEEELISVMLQNGSITPRELWESRDKEIPAILKDSPALDLPMPIAMGLQYLDAKEQQDMMMEQAQREQAESEAGAQASRAGALPQGQSRPAQIPGGQQGPQGPRTPQQVVGQLGAPRRDDPQEESAHQPSTMALRRPGPGPEDRV